MKVIEINSVCGIRSTGRICTDIADVMDSVGYECRIAYGRESVPEKYEEKSIRIGNHTNVKWHGLMSRLFGCCGFYSRISTYLLLRKIDQFKPDVVHLHNLHGYYLHIGILFRYLRKKQIPVVWTLHDCWAFTGHCAHFSDINCEQWKTKCVHCPKTRSYPTCWLRDHVARNFEKKRHLMTQMPNMVLVTPSQWLAGIVKQSFLGKYPVEVIHNGIDLNIFFPVEGDFRKRYQLENKHIVLGVAAAWGRSKGLYDFIELSHLLPEEYQIVLVGLTKKQITKIPDGILCIERTNSAKELAVIYSAADVFVNPSRLETMGLVTVEALACGTPCVVSNATAVPEVIDETCGCIVEAGDVEAICREIQRIVKDNAYSKTACLQRASQYEKKHQFNRYIELYKELQQASSAFVV